VPVTASRAAVRVSRILRALADAASALSLSEIARRVDVHPSTCQPLLLGLCAEGLVVRNDATATYRLGPGLIDLGEAARDAVGHIEAVHTEIKELRQQFGATAMAGVTDGVSIVVVAVDAVEDPYGQTITAGTRLRLRAPIGPVYVAWSGDGPIDAWLDGADPPLPKHRRAALIRELAEVRARGWSATLRGSRSADDAATREFTPDDFDAERLPVIGLSAPIWDQRGSMLCSLALAALPLEVGGREVRVMGDAVVHAADRITRQLGGHRPH
jgi:DNA-binding IclR family transcriptional regulator